MKKIFTPWGGEKGAETINWLQGIEREIPGCRIGISIDDQYFVIVSNGKAVKAHVHDIADIIGPHVGDAARRGLRFSFRRRTNRSPIHSCPTRISGSVKISPIENGL